MVRLRPLLLLLAAIVALARPGAATWSIVIIDTRTGEVAIGSATCLLRFDLRVLTPIVVVGKGVAVAQAFEDPSGANKILIHRELQRGTPPSRILQMLSQQDSQHRIRQYAIVDTSGAAVTFTGSGVLGWKGALTGRIDTLVYAIQGNLLTGEPVVLAAEQAVRNTQGDMPAKLMAAMQAARSMGGDGRCSCSTSRPSSCGSPPPRFTRSAHIGYMIVARQGDIDGPCDPQRGCAQGSYYLNLNVPNGSGSGPDPVDVLQGRFDQWRRGLTNRTDHHNSTVGIDGPGVPADGQSVVDARIQLVNHEGAPFRSGGARVNVALDPASTAQVRIGSVTDNQDGTYTVPLRAGTSTGEAQLRISVDDGGARPILLSPRTAVIVHDDALWTPTTELSARDGGTVEFVYGSGAAAGSVWALLASTSGSSPGIQLAPGLLLPLNPDPVFFATMAGVRSGYLPLVGLVPVSGRVTTRVPFPQGAFSLVVGTELTFASTVWVPLSAVSNPVTIEIVP